MPVGIQRLNAKRSQPNSQIIFIKTLKGPDEHVAQDFLERIAAQCVPVMKKHHLSVMTLEEFPPNREFVGRNFNAGECIQLVLKSPRSGRWLPFRYVQMVMMHELAHCKQMNHSRAFWAVRNLYASQMTDLWARQYTGEGIWGRGANLATGLWEKDVVAEGEVLPEHLCGGTYRSRRRRKRKAGHGVADLTYQEKKQRRIEKKFGKNGVSLGADEQVKVELEKGKKVAGKPRVAGSGRGRELRAAAALARFEKQKEVEEDVDLKAESDTESGSDTGGEDDDDGDDSTSAGARDVDGSRLKDEKGRRLVKVCEDEDKDDPDAKTELRELQGVLDRYIKKEPSPDVVVLDDVQRPPRPSTSPAQATSQIEPEATASRRQPGPPPSTAGTSVVSVKEEETNEAITCRMCSYENPHDNRVCDMCDNYLWPDDPQSWKCSGAECRATDFLNSPMHRRCGLCGRLKEEKT